jgi:hypothetical protein
MAEVSQRHRLRTLLDMVLGRMLCAVAVLLTAVACAVLGDDDGAYSDELVKFDDDSGEPNRYVNLDDGRAQLSIGSPDGHAIVVQWRDPDGSGWTGPETIWDDEKNTAIDNTVRYGGGTVGIIQTYTPDVHKDSDIGDVHIGIVCRDRSCDVGRSPGYAGEAQVTPDGSSVYLGQDEEGVTLWTSDRGIHRVRWSGHPGFEYGVVSPSRPLLSPDGSLRVVGSRPSRGSCAFDLYAAAPGTADLERVGRSTQQTRGRSDCATYLDTFSADWVQVSPSDPSGRTFWFVREGDSWVATRRDPSGLRLVDVDRGCCDTVVAGFIHWNSLASSSPDGRRIQVQSHLLGDEAWSEPQLLDGAPPGVRCTYLEGHEVGDGYAVLLVCHSGKVRDEFVGDAYAVAASPDLRSWESRFVTGVREMPAVEDDRLRVGDTTWTPEDGFVSP